MEIRTSFKQLKTRPLIPFFKRGKLYIGDIDAEDSALNNIVGILSPELKTKTYIYLDGNVLKISLDNHESSALMNSFMIDGVRYYRMPDALAEQVLSGDKLISLTYAGFDSDCIKYTVQIIDKSATKPVTLLQRFVYNSANLCAVSHNEHEGEWMVKEPSIHEVELYHCGGLVCSRMFNFIKNTDCFVYYTGVYDVVERISNEYPFLSLPTSNVTEKFKG